MNLWALVLGAINHSSVNGKCPSVVLYLHLNINKSEIPCFCRYFDNPAPGPDKFLKVMICWSGAFDTLLHPRGEGRRMNGVERLQNVVRVVRHPKVGEIAVDRCSNKHSRPVRRIDTGLLKDVVHIVDGAIVKNKEASPIEYFRVLCV